MKDGEWSLGMLLLYMLIGLSTVIIVGGILYLLIPWGEAIKVYLFPAVVTRP
jgi:hypothetical protein